MEQNYYNIGTLNIENLEKYSKKIISKDVILTKERLFEHILVYHKKEYEQLKDYLKVIIENPDFILEDNSHINTLIYNKI